MNRITILVTTLALTLTAAACKGKEGAGGSSGGGGAAKTTETAAKAAPPTLAINDADWVEKDLSTVSPMVHVKMRVPKDAKLEKNGNGGVDVLIADFYMLTVGANAVSNIAEAIKDQKSMTIESTSWINGKVVTEEPNGLIYSVQMKTEENGTTYQPETHFIFVVEKEGAIYTIHDEKPLSSSLELPGSTWNEDLAKKVYAIVKASAKAS